MGQLDAGAEVAPAACSPPSAGFMAGSPAGSRPVRLASSPPSGSLSVKAAAVASSSANGSVVSAAAGTGTSEDHEADTVFLVHLESLKVDGTSPSRREVVASFVEREVDESFPARSPLIRTPLRAPLTPSTAALHPEAEATLLTEHLMQDSFLLDLPEDRVESRLERVRAELKGHFDIDEIEEATAIESLLDREYEKHESAFYLVDLGTVVRKYEQWVTLLPNVKPFYAIKSNPNHAIIRTLKAIGTGFDCASQAELETVISMGVPPEDIIFANPCKMPAHIKFAQKHGVKMMTFDNLDELQKIHEIYPEAELILRLLPPDASSALCNFGSKFGANPKMTKSILKTAARMKANLSGVSFHVGSGCWDPKAYDGAIQLAYDVCHQTATEFGFNIKYVDIGGGFPAADNTSAVSFPTICDTLNPAIARLFPKESGIQIIGEPGRYLCGEAVVLAVNVIAKRTKVPAESTAPGDDDEDGENESAPEEEEEEVLYYLSDGVYGSFNNIMYDHQSPVPQVSSKAMSTAQEQGQTSKKSTLFGPTCDSIDVICRDVKLPDLDIGSWLYFLNMGAYTMAAASSFNGFAPPPCKYIITPGNMR